MRRRRFTPEQRENILKAKEKQRRACARGNHWWYPDYSFEKGRPIEPKFWTVEERFPLIIWDGKSVICTSCKVCGQMKNLSPKKQKKMQDIFDIFNDSALSLRKDYAKTG